MYVRSGARESVKGLRAERNGIPSLPNSPFESERWSWGPRLERVRTSGCLRTWRGTNWPHDTYEVGIGDQRPEQRKGSSQSASWCCRMGPP